MMEIFTPRSLIAGRVQVVRGNSDLETITSAAGAILGMERIACIYSRTGKDIWYLAVPAADLASHDQSASPLAMALPGIKNHAGEGAYLLDLEGGWQVVLVKHGTNLHSYVGTPALAQRFIGLEGATTTHHCAALDPSSALPWQFPAAITLRHEIWLRAAITASGLAVALCAAGIWMWSAWQNTHLDELRAHLRQQHQTAWNTAIETMRHSVAYPQALAYLQKAIEQAIAEQGVVVRFEYQAGRAVWTLNAKQQLISGGAP